MKLLGRDIPTRELMSRIESRLRARGMAVTSWEEPPPEGVEPRIDPLSFNLHALEENADCTNALPRQTHRSGLSGKLVIAAKEAFRSAAQGFINEALGRQRIFNGHVRDSYAQLSAEVIRLREEVSASKAEAGVKPSLPKAQGPSRAVVLQAVEAANGNRPGEGAAARAKKTSPRKAVPPKSAAAKRAKPGSKAKKPRR